MHPAYQQPANSPVSNVSGLLGSVGVVGLQLNQMDIEILNKLPHPLSSYDLNILSNPDMHQELSTIINFIKAGGSLASLLEQSSSSQNHSLPTMSTPIDEQLMASLKDNSSKTSHKSEDSRSIPVASSNGPMQDCIVTKLLCTQPTTCTPLPNGISLTPLQPMITPRDTTHSVANKSMGSVQDRHSSSPILRPLSEEVKVLETGYQPDYNYTGMQMGTVTSKPTSTANVDYCDRSPAEFTVRYPNDIGRVEEEVVAIEEDPAYPFLCSDDEDIHSLTLNQLRGECESDWEDDEEPIRKTKTTKTRSHPRHHAIEPVTGDWNCWKESEYVEKMKKVINSIITTVPVATPSFLQSDSNTDSSQCSTSTNASESVDDELQSVRRKHQRGGKFRVQCQTKQPVKRLHGHTRKWWAKRKEKRSMTKKMQSSKHNSHPNTSSTRKQPTSRNIEIGDYQRRNDTTQTNISSNEPCLLTQEKDEVLLECTKDPSSMVVSIPFVKLLTSRQMKKYCSKLLES